MYAQLQTTSNFTFLTGASHPDELVARAAELGYQTIALTDVNTVGGVVRAHLAAKEAGITLAVGCHLQMPLPWDPDDADAGDEKLSVLVYPTDRASYGRLCRLLTLGKRRAGKGGCELGLHDLIEHERGLLAVAVPPRVIDERFVELIHGLRGVFDNDRLSIAGGCAFGADDRQRLAQVAALCAMTRVPMVATNDVHYHAAHRRALQDVLTCIRLGCTLDQAGLRLAPNAERYLKPVDEMARLFCEYPQALARSVQIARRAAGFNLDQLKYEYPGEVCPPGLTPQQYLTQIAWRGAHERYPQGIPAKVSKQITHELDLIADLKYAPYFLTVHDIVVFARSRGILCQGRGAAANSAVCYCLGVTAVDPDRIDVLFERFVSKQRNEPPDIDIDFEHERREEVIQYIYRKYGRMRAALTAEVITYRGRSAIRDVGKALGLSLDLVDRLAKSIEWFDPACPTEDRLREMGLDPSDATLGHLLILCDQLLGFPRHRSQHVGGFVISRGALCESVPIENAAMPDRTIIEWDKDDIEAVGMLKVDVLGLGMLTAIAKGLDMVNRGLRDQGTKGLREERGDDGWRDPHIPGFDRMAAGDGARTGDLRSDDANARRGALRVDAADAAVGGVGAVEHRRGLRPARSAGLSPVSEDRPRLVGGTEHAAPTGGHNGDVVGRRTGAPTDGRNRTTASIADHQSESKPQGITAYASSLSPLVPWSLSPFFAPLQLHTIPPEDPAVYDMICEADTVGVFQIESRAQMSMLPRLKPRCYYDLVIEVALVRPGPIVGDMVHPYLRRRDGKEPVSYPDDNVKKILGKTLGVPLFQEQAMQLAITCAGFTADEADQLRRAIAAWKSKQKVIYTFGRKIVRGMTARGYTREFAERCFEQIKGFSEYGFPESHSASFALLVYVSAWLKKHHPAAFCAALLNSQPMGFYGPAQLVRDARQHGVEVRPVDVNRSGWDCSLEDRRGGDGIQPAVRLGMRMVKGLGEAEACKIERAVAMHGAFRDAESLWRASGVKAGALRRLAGADALASMGLSRRDALWAVRKLRDEPLPLFDQVRESASLDDAEPRAALPTMSESQAVMRDYEAVSLSLRAHPVSFLREKLRTRRLVEAGRLADEKAMPHGARVGVAGLVLVRQRPGSASGVTFMTLEDETGIANLIVWPDLFERYRAAALHGVAIAAYGRVQRQGKVVHVRVDRIEDLSHEVGALSSQARNFH